MRDITRRLGFLEQQAQERRLQSSGCSEARQHMLDHLSRIAEARRSGGLSEELAAEVEAVRAAVRRRRMRTWGEG